MKLILYYVKRLKKRIICNMSLKMTAALLELSLPYILEHILDHVVPCNELLPVILWSLLMIVMAFSCRALNVAANRMAIAVATDSITDLRARLFEKTMHLSGSRFDYFTLPSNTSRMTADSYNIQSFMASIQMMGVRSPILLIGGLAMTFSMDAHLALILLFMVPILFVVVIAISRKGIPLYDHVQRSLDRVVRVMRENITGIRVIKALSREERETARFHIANETFTKDDVHAGVIMAIPGPFMQLCLNSGLAAVVVYGAHRVNDGLMQPGVILAFLTYFNLIMMAVMGINRFFIMTSKAAASADRIQEILDDVPDLTAPVSVQDTHSIEHSESELCVLQNSSCHSTPQISAPHITFRHVTFSYHADQNTATNGDKAYFGGGTRKACLQNIHFSVERGQTLGIIGATGSGKTSLIRLLMRFYDPQEGCVEIDGQDIRSIPFDALRNKFGVVFQNDIIFNDTIRNNIVFDRNLTEEDVLRAAAHAEAAPFIETLEGTYDFEAAIKGANLSGGQKQRILIARALAGNPEILVLDDSSSALDYKTDSKVRAAIRTHYPNTTLIMIAQRISSVMHLDKIIVMEDGLVKACGTHEELLQSSSLYKEIFDSQMGEGES